jgi:hypothetical protein
MRWIRHNGRYFRVDWASVRMVFVTPTLLALIRDLDAFEDKALMTPTAEARIWTAEGEPVTLVTPPIVVAADHGWNLQLGHAEDRQQAKLVLELLRSSHEWIELTVFGVSNPPEPSLFLRLVDVDEMHETPARMFHGPLGDVELPQGLTITLKTGRRLATFIRAVGPCADRLRRIVRGDWEPGDLSNPHA